jgi:WD40 repeat protein
VGKAKVVVRFDAWKAGHVAPSEHGVPVSVPKHPALKLEDVSPRLKQQLIHPNRGGTLTGVSYSPDGKRLLAGDVPAGTVAVWDVTTGSQLSLIETDYGRRSYFPYFSVSPDWKTLYLEKYKRKVEAVEQAGKRLWHYQCDGDVRAWEIDTGKLIRKYRHDPPRGIHGMRLFENGATFLTFETLSGTYQTNPEWAISAWDVKSGQYRSLPADLNGSCVNSPDGRVLAVTQVDENACARALKLFDVATWQERWATPIKAKDVRLNLQAFSSDQGLIVAESEVQTRSKNQVVREAGCRWYDVSSGKEVASFVGKNGFFDLHFSPDGNTLAASTGFFAETTQLFLFSVAERKLVKTIDLAKKQKGGVAFTYGPVFSPDGKWLAVATQMVSVIRGQEADARDVPQARIHLIDASTGELRETLIAPQGYVRSLCFSPDSRALATAGFGRVLLWDLSKPPACH